jgi:hypothetical protein
MLKVSCLYVAVGALFVLVACQGKTDVNEPGDNGGNSSVGGENSNVGGSTFHGGGNTSTSGGTHSSSVTSSTGGSVQGGAANLTQCVANDDCGLRAKTCCGICGAPSSTDVIALSVEGMTQYTKDVCGGGPVPCPACATQMNPDLFATCRSGNCKVVDLATSDLSACQQASDCVLRAATCCECNASVETWNLVALSKSALADYASQVCGSEEVCAKCMPIYPTTIVPACVSGHCQISR